MLAWPQPAYSFAIAALGSIDFKGNNIASDSFDSSDPLYSTNGLYTASKRKAGGDIICNSDIPTAILNVGNANIAGHIQVGPDGHFAILNGTVGDLEWVDSNTPGVQPGWAVTNRSYFFPPVALPTLVWLPSAGPGAGGSGTAPDGKSYAHIFTSPLDTIANPGNYTVPDSGDIYVGTNVSVRLNVTAAVFKPNNIFVAGVNPSEAGRMLAYLNGPAGMSVTLGTTDKTQSGRAWNLMFMGLPNCTDVSYSGNGDFTAAIYAPNADFHLAGGGSGYIDFIGSSVTRTFQVNGHYHFHFDEDLYRTSSPFPFLFPASIEGQVLLVGQNATFEASAIGAEPFSYQWQFQGINIPGATNSSLSLTNVQLADAGYYYVNIMNVAGSVTNSARLQVYPIAATLFTQGLSTNGDFQFYVGNVPVVSYVIEASSNLVDWSPVGTNVSGTWFTESNTAAFPQRFYRAVFVP